MEFVKPFEDEIDYELVMRTIFKTRGEEWGFLGLVSWRIVFCTTSG